MKKNPSLCEKNKKQKQFLQIYDYNVYFLFTWLVAYLKDIPHNAIDIKSGYIGYKEWMMVQDMSICINNEYLLL